MKILLFLLIFCVVGIYTQKHNDSAEKNKHAMDIEDCLNQHSNITKKGLSVKDIILKSIAPYDLGCITSCLKKKELKNGVTLNSYVIQNAYLPSTKFPDWYEKKNEDYQYVVIANRCINEVAKVISSKKVLVKRCSPKVKEIMKLCWIILIALCIFGINARPNSEPDNDGGFEPLALQCLRELKKDPTLSAKNCDEIESSLTDDERNCILACMFRRNDPDKKSLYEYLKSQLSTIDNRIQVYRDELLEKLNSCKALVGEGNDCGVMKCIELFKPPFAHWYLQTN
ncbi:uncharacterized protein LOC107982182 isoform X1 [Nasonia vitripennis]|uniref:Uncharacterized protein n=3 Tax=Nasonia vitripennis TaxID=7425 RepID=A0A7M7QH61_NASVI|nr:uncharacterized protein LOC107982182 isoform X1 [Nasonia vitripennis]